MFASNELNFVKYNLILHLTSINNKLTRSNYGGGRNLHLAV